LQKKNSPKFGEDLVIDQNAKSTDNYSNLGSSYFYPDYVFGSPRAKNLLADSFFSNFHTILTVNKLNN